MSKYLIDANLPFHFSIWHSDDYEHVRDIDKAMSDEKIWEYAKKHNLTIVTKDADFSNRIIVSEPPPKVVHIRIGNKRLRDFYEFINKHWDEIKALSNQHKLVNVYDNKLWGID